MSVEALKSAINLIHFRGWAPGHSDLIAVCEYRPNAPETWLGAIEDRGPVCMVSALAHAQATLFRSAYEALRLATGAQSLSVWEAQPGRTQAEVLEAFERATSLVPTGRSAQTHCETVPARLPE